MLERLRDDPAEFRSRAQGKLATGIGSLPKCRKGLPDCGHMVTLPPVNAHSISPFPDPKGADLPKATAIFSGPLRVKLDDGKDIAPKSPLRQAILAVLVSAPGQIKARRSLQNMFWASADSAHAAANLRTALYQLRQDLKPLGHDILRTDRQNVSLCPGVLIVDLGNGNPMALLEGLDLPLTDCDGFEDWLRALRQIRGAPDLEGTDRVQDGSDDQQLARPRLDALAARNLPSARMALGLLPTVHAGLSEVELLQIEASIDQIARFFNAFTLLEVHDLRDTSARVLPLPLASGRGPTHLLQAIVHFVGGAVCLRMRLVEAYTRKLIWLSDPMPSSDTEDGITAWRVGELIVDRMRSHPTHAKAPDLFPFTALTALFSLDAGLIEETEVQLLRMVEQGGHPVLNCLQLFAHVFKVHEQIGASCAIDTEHLVNAVSDLSAADPLLPLCQSLLGYALHMLRGENDLAVHLIENAYRMAPNFSLNLDHLAVINLVRGDLDAAEAAWRRLMVVGQQSPWRYTYDITGAMIQMMRGDLRQSLYLANQSMFRKPRFLAALRYSMLGFALSNRPEDATRMLGRIRVLRPGYDLSNWAEGFVARMPVHLANSAVQSLRQIELL